MRAAKADSHSQPSAPLTWRLSDQEARHAIDEAYAYGQACVEFPAWHKNVYSCVRIEDSLIEFAPEMSPRSERVMAYEKGIRPKEFYSMISPPKPEIKTDEALHLLIAKVLSEVTLISARSIQFGDVLPLEMALFQRYEAAISRMFRREPTLNLGSFTFADFRKFYAALLAIAASHEHLCFLWEQRSGWLPRDQLLVLKSKAHWRWELTKLSGLQSSFVHNIFDQLTYQDAYRSQDISVRPFIPLEDQSDQIAIVPGFVLSTNSEENILRACAQTDPHAHGETANSKEAECRSELERDFPHLNVDGGISMRKGMPDLDLVIEDIDSNSVMFAELKWLQVPQFLDGRAARVEEIRKGERQIKQIKAFLVANPRYLQQRGLIYKSIDAYQKVLFCVICRDFIVDGASEIAIYSFNALTISLKSGASLGEAVDFLASDAWLPSPNVDYVFGWNEVACNGVILRSQQYRVNPNPLALIQL